MKHYLKMNGKIKKRQNTSIEDTKVIKEYALERIKESYLTGASAIVESKGISRKVAKFAILVLCFIGFLWQTFLFLNLYWQYPTITVIGNIKHMLKPAITICDKNLISRRYICDKYPLLCDDFTESVHRDPDRLGKFCRIFPGSCANKNDMYFKIPKELNIKFKSSYYDYNFVRESGFQITECLFLCAWTNVTIQERTEDPIACSKPSYVRVLNENKYPGACYTLSYNSNPNSFTADKLNPQANLVLILNWRNSDIVNVALNLHNSGEPREYYISFHDPSRQSNPFLEGIVVRDYIAYRVKVSQINNIRLPPPYASECLDYESAWRRNGKQGPLTKEECYQNCQFEEELKKYGCVTLKVNLAHKEKLCLDKLHLDPEMDLKIKTCQEKCKDACFETKYLATPEIYTNVRNSLRLYNASSVVILKVSFDISNSKEYKDIPKFEAIEVFSYVGSYLSMWLGWSCIAVFDFLDIFSRIFLFACKKTYNFQRFCE